MKENLPWMLDKVAPAHQVQENKNSTQENHNSGNKDAMKMIVSLIYETKATLLHKIHVILYITCSYFRGKNKSDKHLKTVLRNTSRPKKNKADLSQQLKTDLLYVKRGTW